MHNVGCEGGVSACTFEEADLWVWGWLHVQIQSNALAALEALDPQVAEEVLAAGCITGDRINGLCDGETGKWYNTAALHDGHHVLC